ncbi:MAG: hypothetical protein SF051_11945 [Elusimicrobiota bacterium]|nr:hypothetical protein [Elusimicrobiota bacterium]
MPDGHGCAACWPDSPEAAWESRRALAPAAELVDESHYGVRLLGCPACGQRFLSVFTERVDWADGEDPQHWALMPVTLEEAVSLAAAPTEAAIDALAPRRRSLRRDFPKGGEPRCFWDEGARVRPHD